MSGHATGYRTHTCGELRPHHVGKVGPITLAGHVAAILEGPALLLRDSYGATLVVVDADAPEFVSEAFDRLGPEDVIQVRGKLALRPTVDEELATGAVQVMMSGIEILSSAEPPPDALMTAPEVPYEDRLAHRQLYLRRPEMQDRFRVREQVVFTIRDYLIKQGFLELETPQLFWYDQVATDPEPVPVAGGRAFALPSGPVVLNQYIKAGQFDRFFQFVRITRREINPTPMHGSEYTALDLNMAYADREDFCRVVEGLLAAVAKDVFGINLPVPFASKSFAEALQTWGTDKPDLRDAQGSPLAGAWVHTYPFFTRNQDGDMVPDVVVFSRVFDDDLLMAVSRPEDRHAVRSQAFDLVLNGVELASAYVGNHNLELQRILWENLFQMGREDMIRLRAPVESHRFGLPPHVGMNLGFDRLMAILLGLEGIDEAMAFPKEHGCRDRMLRAPGPVPEEAVADIVADAEPPTFTLDDYLKEIVES